MGYRAISTHVSRVSSYEGADKIAFVLRWPTHRYDIGTEDGKALRNEGLSRSKYSLYCPRPYQHIFVAKVWPEHRASHPSYPSVVG